MRFLNKWIRRHPAVRLFRWEWSLWADLVSWLRGTTQIPPHATALPHQPGRLQLIAGFTVIIVIEIVIAHLLIPVEWLRWIALIVSVYSLVMLWCFIASERIRPSFFTAETLVLRRGRKVFTCIPFEAISHLRRERTFASEIHHIASATFTMGGAAGTDTTVTLTSRLSVAADSWPWQKVQPTQVHEVRFFAGDAYARLSQAVMARHPNR